MNYTTMRLGEEKKKKKKKKETTGQKYNGLPYYIGRPQRATILDGSYMAGLLSNIKTDMMVNMLFKVTY